MQERNVSVVEAILFMEDSTDNNFRDYTIYDGVIKFQQHTIRVFRIITIFYLIRIIRIMTRQLEK